MKLKGWFLVALFGCAVLSEAACGPSRRPTHTSDDDDDDSTTTSSSTTTTSSGTSGAGGTGAGGCSSPGESCSTQSCCKGLVCDQGTCIKCNQEGKTCATNGDCCSKVCTNGACVGSCGGDGDLCSKSSQCCSNQCIGGQCSAPTCASCWEYFTGNSLDMLCPSSESLYDAYATCICTNCAGPCQEACNGMAQSSDCDICVQEVSQGACKKQYTACAND